MIHKFLSEFLQPEGTLYHGSPLTSQESMGPLLESLIVIQWLEAIHPQLPGHVRDHYGHLFTKETPNFCDVQPQLCGYLETMLQNINQPLPKAEVIQFPEDLIDKRLDYCDYN